MNDRTGVLLIHGLGGTRHDLGSMHKAIRRAGGDAHMITLPGHGTRPEDLAEVRAEAWLDAVVEQYRQLEGEYDTLHVAGMCMGALVALLLCHRVGHARGRLALLAAPVFIDGWSTPWYRPLRHLIYRLPQLARRMRVEEGEPFGIKNPLVRAIVKKKFERQDNFHYPWVPLSCVGQVDRMRAWVQAAAPETRCPTLVVHAREDELTSLRSQAFLQETLPDARSVVLEDSYHMICADNDRDEVARQLLAFFGFDPVHAVSPAMARRMGRGSRDDAPGNAGNSADPADSGDEAG
ncbi:alpha/beta hydrolase [Burkholderia gladioli]|uniref:alpha/beta hydrolase n=1 Tax=Burkholderia gladioli TaxID=28095 RepID=UPI00163FB7C1|nr:alpha/beta fold hydrolase [Burkholderia gladioli]MDA0569643.1 alpha/beta fold hydrolase [Burkholderia gladioli]MDA0597865.1 alpha/beta fold hydrolase [Burkholderia gladioli]